ncbi:hypothetical protein CQW23_14025 [Capsicum baccatum]|uniref:M-phase phosphoprotein 6 n=1 Tax=Capsicum baccatum TaxID=33114 RepID=A0A2G2WHY9_CAPBA|nr:hypothetical protein CQW23_14025 [Capsicum baccatum]
MAKRELSGFTGSSCGNNLLHKAVAIDPCGLEIPWISCIMFMQRASLREEKPKKEEDKEVVTDGNFPSSSAPKRCVIIMEGDPHPGAVKGRMSFQGFNPSIDKLSEEGSAACSPEMSDRISKRENGTSQCGFENTDLNDSYDEANKDLTRKQRETYSEAQYSNKSHKRALDNPTSSQSSSRSFKKPHRPDWSVLKPPKSQNKMR